MLWIIYGSVIALTALVAGLLGHYFIDNKKRTFLVTLGAVLIALLFTHLIIKERGVDAQLETSIRKESSFLDLIADKSPEEFNAYLVKVKKNRDSHGNPDKEALYFAELMNNLLSKYGPYASDESLYEFLKSDIDFDKQLIQSDPLLVLYHEFPNKFADDKNLKKINKNLYNNSVLNAAQKVILSALENPQPLPDEAAINNAKKLFFEVYQTQVKKYGVKNVTNALQKPNDPAVDKKQAAEIVISFSEGIFAMGEANAALILKSSLLLGKPKET